MRRLLIALLLVWSLDAWGGTLEVYRGCVLGWDANTEPDLAGYRVYTHQLGGVYPATFVLVTAPTTTVSCAALGLTQGHYLIQVRAIDQAVPPNESPVSNEIEVNVNVPVRAR